jgi:hypothetical protein
MPLSLIDFSARRIFCSLGKRFEASACFEARNSIQSLAGFIYDVSPDLMAYTDRLEKEARAREVAVASAGTPEEALSNAEVARLACERHRTSEPGWIFSMATTEKF